MHGCERECASLYANEASRPQIIISTGREAVDSSVCTRTLDEPKNGNEKKEMDTRVISAGQTRENVHSIIHSLRRMRISLIHLIPWHLGHVIVLRVSVLIRIVVTLLVRRVVVHGRIPVLFRRSTGVTLHFRTGVRRIVPCPRRRQLCTVDRAR